MRAVVGPGVLVLALVLGSCGQGGDDVDATSPSPASPQGSDDAAAEGADGPQEQGWSAVNPVIADDFPDPDVLEVDGVYYAYATNGNNRNVRVARSTDLVEWEALPDALPDLPSWVIPGKTWAPEVTELEPGRYVMYFTATSFQPTLQCIGVATSDSPEGPFEVVGDQMLVCPPDEGGAIDAATFRHEDGTLYLLWKNDGNCCGLDTWLYLAPLSADGTALVGEAVPLVQQDQPWEGNLVEAPTLVERDGTFVLLYSANDYGGDRYAIGYATAPAIEGPWTKDPEPLLTTALTQDRYVGPGGQDVVVGPDGQEYLLFHSWYGGTTYRAMIVLPLSWEDGRPVVAVD
ncbi:glycoside hydrolase family 43 protein [Actinotalea sp. K2]|uniref:glycoside hydrolase family 43 protein n=1 Tax=Actinotalea sp. K2 TaxID=2939438 RepID=UPI0020172652|nr:glycoside hydrolase family 43 protein [Actinotalea sp. K2]MCL3861044.1 glycoside hydrolase family 43 protein [Actinotalea sp. K2]